MDIDKLNWKSVSLKDVGFNANFEGLIGIEECTDYGVLSKNKRKRGGKKDKLKRKALDTEVNVISPKKAKNSQISEFQVESVDPETLQVKSTIDSNVSEKKNKPKKDKIVQEADKTKINGKTKKKNKKKQNKKVKKDEAVTSEDVEETNDESKKLKVVNGKSKKKNKKKQNKKGKKVDTETNEDVDEEINEDVDDETNEDVDDETNEDVVEETNEDVDDETNEDVDDETNEDVDDETNDKEAVKDEAEEISLSELQSWAPFNLPEVILKGLAAQGFTKPTLIQELTLPAAIFGRRDILGAAETGSGKTLAFGIPMINAILQLKQKPFFGMKERYKKPKKPKAQEVEEMKKKNEEIIKKRKESQNRQKKKDLMERYKQMKQLKLNKRKRKHDSDSESDDDLSDVSDPENSDDDIENFDDDDSAMVDDVSDLENDKSDAEDESLDENDIDSGANDVDFDENDSDNENGSDVDDQKLDKSESDDEDDSDSEDGVKNSAKNTKSGSKRKSTMKTNKKNSEKVTNGKQIGDDEESDFEEKEENVDGVNEDGIGCVKAIDNISIPGLPELQEIRRELKPLYGLVLTPTRELAIQVKNHLVAAAKFTDISVAVVVGGMSQEKQERLLSKGPEIVVATPGRLWQLIQMGNPHLSQVPDIKFLAIDETDRMLERGHFEELQDLLERLNEDEDKRGGRQNFVFSATLTMIHDLPNYLKKKKVTKKGKIINKKMEKLTADQKLKKVISMLGITDPKIIDITKQNQGASTTLMECRISCPIDHKDYYLYYVLKRHPGRTIIFCNSIGCVKRLTQLFGLLQCCPLPLHASMQQRQRLKNLDKFRSNPHGVLVATDVAARGLDIPDVEHVIHYQVPRTAENYVHRSGRTARASKEGITILIMEPGEVHNYNKMCKTLNKQDDLPHFPIEGPILQGVMQRVDVAREVDVLMLRGKKETSHRGWLEKAAKEMDIIIDERNMPHESDDESSSSKKQKLFIKRKHLNYLLATPLFPKGFSFKYPSLNTNIEEALGIKSRQNAIEVMKSALETGADNKKRNATKNNALLKLERKSAPVKNPTNQKISNEKNIVASTENVSKSGEKVSKNKWKKMKRINV